MVKPLEIKSQGANRSDFCTGCVIASIAEPYVGEPCDEAYSFAMGRRVSGKAPSDRGLDPKSALRGAVTYGVLPKSMSPFTGREPREFLSDWRNWEPYMAFAAKPFVSFRRVTDPSSALTGDVTLMTGLHWQGEWDASPYVESAFENHRLSPHEVRIIGERDGYYVVQNSRGSDVGDGGLWYIRTHIPLAHAYRFTTTASRFDPLLELF